MATVVPDHRPRTAWLAPTLDWAEKAFVLGLFAFMAFRVFTAVRAGGSAFNVVQLASEGLAVGLILFRKSAVEFSIKPLDWFLAMAATAGPLLVKPGGAGPIGPASVAVSFMLTGLICQVYGKLTLRFSFGMVPANRGLKVGGPYGLVRHPIYLSYLIGQVGFFLLNPTVWNGCVYGASLVLQLFRIEAEERVLALDEGHAAFRAAVRYKLIPGLY